MTGSVIDFIRIQVLAGPDRTAVRCGADSVTYQQLWDRAGVLSVRLHENGARPGDVIGICAPRSVALFAGILGILRAGCAYLPLDDAYPPQRLEYMLRQAGATVLAGHPETAAAALRQGRTLVTLDGLDDAARPDPEPVDPPVTGDDLVYVMFTSGSTGLPKGVMQTHGAMSNMIRWQLADSEVGPGEVTAQFAPISFDVSFQEIFATLAAGGVLLCLGDERRDPVLLWKLLARERVARLYLPFVMLRTLALFADELRHGVPPLREVITAGEQLRCDDRVKRLFALLPGCRLVNHYGPTETHVCTRYLLPADPQSWPLLPPIGAPIDGVRLHVVDSGGRPVPEGEPGELYVAGIAVARGYIGRPDLTDERFRPEPHGTATMYATGDVVRWRDGQWHYLGRNDDQVKVSGIRVEPAEIERELLSFPGVREAAVVARRDPGSGTQLIAFVTGEADPDRILAIRARMTRDLPAHLVPHRILALPALPTTPSGKLDRSALLDSAEHHLTAAGTAVNTVDLSAIWHAELHVAGEYVDDLRAAGVDSLAAARVAARIARQLGVLVQVDRVLAATSLDHLAEIVAASPPAPRLVAAEPVGPQPITPMQQQILIDELLRDNGPSHWVLAELDITGPFSVAAAEAALRGLTRRHGALRIRFDFTGPQLSQEFVTDAPPVVALTDSADLAALRAQRLGERYELGGVTTPVVDIVRLGAEHHRMLLRLHHACCDGWSLALLIEEFTVLYGGAELPPAVQPWQLPADGDTRDRDLAYWLRRLEFAADRPPIDWGRPHSTAPSLRRIPVVLDDITVSAVRKKVRQTQATSFAVLLAAWAGLFGEQGEEICVAVPFSTRITTQDAACVGLLLNTLVLTLPTESGTFTELVTGTQRDITEAMRHRTAPLPDIVRRLDAGRQAGYHPLAQMMFTLQPPGPRHWILPGGARAELIADAGIPEVTRFDLVLNLDDRGDSIAGWADFDADSVDPAQISALIDRWTQTLLR